MIKISSISCLSIVAMSMGLATIIARPAGRRLNEKYATKQRRNRGCTNGQCSIVRQSKLIIKKKPSIRRGGCANGQCRR